MSNKDNDILFGDAVASEDLLGGGLFDTMEDQEEEVIDNNEASDDKALLDLGDDLKKAEKKDKKESSDKEEVDENATSGLEDLLEKAEGKSKNFKEVALALIEAGEWEINAFEDEDGETIAIEDLESLSEDEYKELKKANLEEKRNKVKEEVIGGLTADEKEFLEFKKNGGNIQDYAQTHGIKEKVNALDISTDYGKIKAITGYYKNIKKKDDGWIRNHIERITKNMTLDEEAEFAKEEITELTKKQHEEVVKKQQQFVEDRRKAVEKYIEDIKSSLKSKNYDTKRVNSIVKGVVETDENGLSEIDKAFLSLRNNPDKIDILWGMLTDTDNFLKKQAKKEVNDSNLRTFKAIKMNKKDKTTRKSENMETSDDVLFEL